MCSSSILSHVRSVIRHLRHSKLSRLLLSTLSETGCSVSEVVWQSDPDFCLLLEWRGESTLDDVAQTAPLESLKETITGALGKFCQLEKSFADCHTDFAPYVYPLDYPTYLRQTMDDMLDRGRKTLGYLARLSSEPAASDLDEVWSNFAQAHPWTDSATLGALDYNARNIVIDAGGISFVDFGSIGWDWSERRIVQFFNSLGANREGGNFVNLLNRDVIRAYASRAITYRSGSSEEDIFTQLDYHNILFYLSIVHRLLSGGGSTGTGGEQGVAQSVGRYEGSINAGVGDSRELPVERGFDCSTDA